MNLMRTAAKAVAPVAVLCVERSMAVRTTAPTSLQLLQCTADDLLPAVHRLHNQPAAALDLAKTAVLEPPDLVAAGLAAPSGWAVRTVEVAVEALFAARAPVPVVATTTSTTMSLSGGQSHLKNMMMMMRR